jgi:hypothetical protein
MRNNRNKNLVDRLAENAAIAPPCASLPHSPSVYRSRGGLSIPSVGHHSQGYFCRKMATEGLRHPYR